jgi:transcriptional regulator with XRE-family HTH domain
VSGEVRLADLACVLRSRRGAATLRDVATACGVSFATLSRIERGGVADVATLQRLAAWLGGPIVIAGPACPCGSPLSPEGRCTDAECPAARGCT